MFLPSLLPSLLPFFLPSFLLFFSFCVVRCGQAAVLYAAQPEPLRVHFGGEGPGPARGLLLRASGPRGVGRHRGDPRPSPVPAHRGVPGGGVPPGEQARADAPARGVLRKFGGQPRAGDRFNDQQARLQHGAMPQRSSLVEKKHENPTN